MYLSIPTFNDLKNACEFIVNGFMEKESKSSTFTSTEKMEKSIGILLSSITIFPTSYGIRHELFSRFIQAGYYPNCGLMDSIVLVTSQRLPQCIKHSIWKRISKTTMRELQKSLIQSIQASEDRSSSEISTKYYDWGTYQYQGEECPSLDTSKN